MKRGECSVCGRSITIRKDGLVRGHGAATVYDCWCQGSLEQPVRIIDRPVLKRPFDYQDTEEL